MTKAHGQRAELATHGRPSKFSREVAEQICERIAMGASLRGICEQPDLPPESTVRGWVREDREGFGAMYARACQFRAELYAEQIIDIADTEPDPQKARVRIDARKWVACKLLPRKYGERVDVTSSGAEIRNPMEALGRSPSSLGTWRTRKPLTAMATREDQMPLTPKRQRFVDEYCRDWNATAAAIRAGYAERGAHAEGHRLLRNAEIAAAIKDRLDCLSMQSDEALVRPTVQARAEYAKFLKADGTVDLQGLIDAGLAHLVKGTKFNASGKLQVEFHDAQAALIHLAKIRGLFIDRHEVKDVTVDAAAIAARLRAKLGSVSGHARTNAGE
ncbi:MAG: terminase small subunit [Phycisphaeraceae bacterium]